MADAFKKAAGNTLKEIVAALLLKIVHNRTISEKLLAGLLLKKGCAILSGPKYNPPPATRLPGSWIGTTQRFHHRK